MNLLFLVSVGTGIAAKVKGGNEVLLRHHERVVGTADVGALGELAGSDLDFGAFPVNSVGL